MPPSIQRVIAAKISEGRFCFRPRTLRTSEALNCLGNCERTERQLMRLPPDAPPARAPGILPERETRLLRRDSSSLSRLNSICFARISLRRLASSARACFWTCLKAELDSPLAFFLGINWLLRNPILYMQFHQRLHNANHHYKSELIRCR